MLIKSKISQTCKTVALTAAIGCVGHASAADTTLQCTLYIAQSMDSSASHAIDLEHASQRLQTIRRAGYCVFDDGRIADKQFVMTIRALEGGKRGTNQGYSVYTLDNGDSISVAFSGSWGDAPYQGTYNILGGTGAYTNATGDGTLSGTKSPWKTSNVVNVVLNVSTP